MKELVLKKGKGERRKGEGGEREEGGEESASESRRSFPQHLSTQEEEEYWLSSPGHFCFEFTAEQVVNNSGRGKGHEERIDLVTRGSGMTMGVWYAERNGSDHN